MKLSENSIQLTVKVAKTKQNKTVKVANLLFLVVNNLKLQWNLYI